MFVCSSASPNEVSTLSLHDALPIYIDPGRSRRSALLVVAHRLPLAGLVDCAAVCGGGTIHRATSLGRLDRLQHSRSEEHTSELQSLTNLVCRLLLAKQNSVRSGGAA